VPEAQAVSRGATASPAAPAQVHGKSVAVKIAAERAVVARAPRADEPERGPSPAETAFVEAWTAFRAGRFASAAQGFGDAGRLDPTGPLSEDAVYWRAVALARTPAPEASAALTDFLRRYPRSAHAPDASLLLERRGAATSPRAPAP
jgi:TolA-binding protein